MSSSYLSVCHPSGSRPVRSSSAALRRRAITAGIVIALLTLSAAHGVRAQPAGNGADSAPAAAGSSAGGPLIVSGEASAGAVRVLGPGDTVVVTVFGHGDLSARVTITADGTISLPLLGEIPVAGRSPSELQAVVRDGLRDGGYLARPQVAVDVVTVRSQVVSLLGEVQRPGRYVIEGDLTVLELLAQAGGLQDDAGPLAVVLRRNEDGSRERLAVPLAARQEPWREIDDVALQAGDVVQVAQQPQFFVYGEVNNAGAYFMEPDLTVMRALVLAGGLTQRASERRLELRRTDPTTGELIRERVGLDTTVRPGDVIHVDERFF